MSFTDPTAAYFAQLKALTSEGFRFVRDSHRWGTLPMFRHDDGRMRFIQGDHILTPKKIFDSIQLDWVPQSPDDIQWKTYRMEAEFEEVFAMHPSNALDHAPEHKTCVSVVRQGSVWEAWATQRVATGPDPDLLIDSLERSGYRVIQFEHYLLRQGYQQDTRYCGNPFIKTRGSIKVIINKRPRDGFFTARNECNGLTQSSVDLGRFFGDDTHRLLYALEVNRLPPDSQKIFNLVFVNPKYHCITQVRDGKDEAVDKLVCDRHWDALAQYLSQWDYGEYHDEPHELPKGQFGDRYNCSVEGGGDYVLIRDIAACYVALYVEAQDTDDDDDDDD